MTGRLQAFPTEEFRASLKTTQAEMRRRGLDMLLVHSPENIYYLTGYQTSGYFAYQTHVVTESTTEPTILVRHIERSNVDEYSWLSQDETWREGDSLVQRTVEVITKLGGTNKVIGFEKGGWFLTTAIAEGLYASLPAAKFTDATLLVGIVRTIKSKREIDYLRKAGRAHARRVALARLP